MLMAGTIYLFGTYSDDLKDRVQFNQADTNLIGTLIVAGTWSAVIGGFFYDRYGPRPTVFGGAFFVSVGYLGLWRMTDTSPTSANLAGLGVMGFLVGQGSGWLYTAALNTNHRNFSAAHRGKVTGVLVSFFGLSSGFFTGPYEAFFEPNVADLFLFLCIFVGCVVCVCGVFLNVVPPGSPFPEQRTSAERVSKRLSVVYVLAVVLAIYTGTAALVEEDFGGKRTARILTGVTFVYMFLFLLVTLGTGQVCMRWRTYEVFYESRSVGALENGDGEDESLLGASNGAMAIPADSSHGPAEKPDGAGEEAPPDMPASQTLQQLNFWLMFVVYMALVGASISVVSNLGNYNKALGGSPKRKDALATLFSIFNAGGRMFYGFMADRYSSVLGRAGFLVIVCVCMVTVQLILAFASSGMLYFAIPLLGLQHGGTFCLMPLLTSELFGLRHFGANWGFVGIGPSLGSLFFSTFLAGRLYDHYSDEQDNGDDGCKGNVCYKLAFCINAMTCTCAAGIAFYLMKRTKHLKHGPSAH